MQPSLGLLSYRHTRHRISSKNHTDSCTLKWVRWSDIESIARSRTGNGKSFPLPSRCLGLNKPPTSMTSWLLTWANRASFEALPQKPHPLERRVKNTELEIISLRATCPEEVGWAVTPQPNHRCKKEGHRAHWVGLSGLSGTTHAQQPAEEALLLHSQEVPLP